MQPITNFTTPLSLSSQLSSKSTGLSEGKSFKDFLVDSIEEVNSMQQDADRAIGQLATGENVTPAEVLTAVQKADIAFQMMMQVRNKIVAAYQEVQNIRV